jgi:hypothetical protein
VVAVSLPSSRMPGETVEVMVLGSIRYTETSFCTPIR